ncbi:MAG: DNA primase [Actinomycetes bacterium]
MSASGSSNSPRPAPGRPSSDDAERVRALLDSFVAALTAHLGAVERRRGETDGAVFASYERLREAFTAYDEALYDSYDEVTPFVVVEDEDEDEDEDDEFDGDDDDDDDDELDDDDDTDLDTDELDLDDDDVDDDDSDEDEENDVDEDDGDENDVGPRSRG